MSWPAVPRRWTSRPTSSGARRSAPDGRSLIEVRVDRRSRADLGIWRRPLGGRGPTTRWLEPIGVEPRFGRTWSTDLVWSATGTELAVQSCGELACRTRIVATATEASSWWPTRTSVRPSASRTGASWRTWPVAGLPCPIVAVDVGTGIRRILAVDAGPAVLTATEAGPRLVHRTRTEAGSFLRSVALDGSDDRMLGAIPDGLDLLAEPAWSAAGTGRPAGWVVLAPAGRMPRDPADAGPVVRHALDGRSAALEEVTR